ncbi:lactate dehydrogenase-like 2-hydroxyacid dehydrogenase [Devosia subaequoris]|uniref:Lactate dehydrogenase-like 2-hydroxyacid dehydrogenase n=1 Tax=Devosia subaequoris TaxID=395930 RepID=A0A7W6INZ0_9HYPH|nr:2-hydroxyacid dehydrogenase [Devosia subaequoris]MBB4053150.1 lactate dehydrogenase-like 2-hydroxyacid dehydrogenase [Devosia subaequoris]MCP1210718.1 2-hydroxyacid dehydrogenase [Devosia subaequoris]
MTIEILQTHTLLASCEEALAARYTVHKLHEMADQDAWLAENGPRIRAHAGSGVQADLMDKLPKLEIIASFGVGYDNIDVGAAKARNIRVTNTPDVLNDAVAEMTIGLMISLARRIPQADQFVRQGKWPSGNYGLFSELMGKTVGIVGLGRIGKEIAVRAQAMKMRVVYHGRHLQPAVPYIYYDDLEDMARDSDWLVVIAPGGQGTEGIVSRNALEALGPRGCLVNVARGTLVDEPAMVELLVNGGLGGAALDVFEKEPQVPAELLTLDNVVLSPHQGSATRQTRDAMGALLVANLEKHFGGEPLISAVV